MADDHVLDEGL